MAAPVIVRAAGPTAGHKTLDIEEAQALVAMEGAIGWEHHVFLDRVRAGVWTSLMTDGRVEVENLQEFDDIVPVGRNEEFPLGNRPLIAHGQHNAAQMARFRGISAALRLMHEERPTGAPGPGAAGTATASTEVQWLFADPARDDFGTPVPGSLLAFPDRFHVTECGSGLLKVPCTTGVNGMRAVFVEKVAPATMDEWLSDKARGVRDKRLTTLKLDPAKPRPLFREAIQLFDVKAVPDATLFEGPSALADLLGQLGRANQEPNVFIEALIHRLGINPRSGVAIEMTIHMWTLYSLAIFDGHDLRRSVAGEHVARRLLQQLKAVRRNAKAPDYDNLETYISHCLDADGGAKVGGFEKHVAAQQRDLAILQKGQRQAREESEALAKTKKEKG